MEINSKSNFLTNFAIQFFMPAGRGINWPVATSIALDSSANIPLKNRKEIHDLYNQALEIIEPLIAKTSGLQIKKLSQIVVCDRGEWLVNTTDNLSVLFEETFSPVWELFEKQKSAKLARRFSQSIMTTQIGLLLGLLSKKVLGQFDTSLPHRGAENLVFIVEPNILEREVQLDLQKAPFRLWILAHELTHNLQFQNFSWIRDYYYGLIQQVADNIAEKVAQSKTTTEATFNLLVNKENWQLISRIQSFMSFIEGYADYVMFSIGKMLPDFEQLQPVFSRQKRPDQSLIKTLMEKILGFDMKANQYKRGFAFVSEICELESLPFLNKKLDGPKNLPSVQELENPRLWLNRTNENPKH